MPRPHIHKRWRNLKPALAVPTQWPSTVVAPRYPSSPLVKQPVTPCLDQDFWKHFSFNLWRSPFWGRQTRSVSALCWCWKALGIYPLPSASSKCDTLLLATKDCFIHKVNARAGSYRLPAQGGVGWSPVAVLRVLEVTCLFGFVPDPVWLREKMFTCGDDGEQHSFLQPGKDARAPNAPENSQHPVSSVL